jgi:hypothetical protein
LETILQEFNTLFLTRFRTYKIATPPRTKKTYTPAAKSLYRSIFLRIRDVYPGS